MSRVVITHREWGIYLGSCFGMGFWTKLDPVGQDSAVTFSSEREARAIIDIWESKPAPDDIHCAWVSTETGYASIDECVAAGLDRWDPNSIPGTLLEGGPL